MSEEGEKTKFRVRLGAAEIEYEGGTQFLKEEIMPTVGKILEMVDARTDLQRPAQVLQLEEHNSSVSVNQVRHEQPGTEVISISLASYLKAKGAQAKQVRRFLATAAWLTGRGAKELTSGLIAKTLQEHQQSRLANPADCLNKNVSKGHCEKTKSGFFITPEGWAELEIPEGRD